MMMTASNALTATQRTFIGKASKRLAQTGELPAVLYGAGREPIALTLNRHDFELFVTHHALGSTIVELNIEGEKAPINAMVKDMQMSPVKDTVLHVDLVEVSMNKPVHAVLPLHLLNDPQGVREGGVLTINVHELNVEAKPGDLPAAIEVDVTDMVMGATLHLSDVPAPKGVTFLDDAETLLASVTAPRAEEEVEEGAEVTEVAVIGEEPEAE